VELGAPQHDGSALREYLRVLRRRKWIVAFGAVVVPLVAVLLSLRQQPLYEATADVLLKHQNLAAGLTGIQDFSAVYEDAGRIADTQAKLASTPMVAERTLRAVRVNAPDEVPAAFYVSADPSSDVLQFRVTYSDPELAVRLVAEYARQYIEYRRELDTAALVSAKSEIRGRIEQLEAGGFQNDRIYERLVETEQQLRTMEALQTSNASLVRSPTDATQIQPQPVRNGVLGLAFGLVFAVGLAFLREALDTRVRSAAEISERLGLPLLGRIPEPPRSVRENHRLVMFENPSGVHAEAFRIVRTNLEFVNLERGARTIMVTSALEKEGKSTTVANLAVALARAGRRVVLVDLDLRRPLLARFFKVKDRPGLTDVALGHADLEEALTPVAIDSVNYDDAAGNGRQGTPVDAVLELLPSGPVPPDPGEFIGAGILAGIIADLRARADVVLFDTPPVLRVGDPMVLSGHVDALIIVSRLRIIRRPALNELKRVLDGSPASKLGFVLTGAELEEGYGYGEYGYAGYYAYGYGADRPRERARVS
jgi:succinoglycan biosynthesis transport protein ExoP